MSDSLSIDFEVECDCGNSLTVKRIIENKGKVPIIVVSACSDCIEKAEETATCKAENLVNAEMEEKIAVLESELNELREIKEVPIIK